MTRETTIMGKFFIQNKEESNTQVHEQQQSLIIRKAFACRCVCAGGVEVFITAQKSYEI